MLISLNEIKKYVQIPEEMSQKELLDLIGSRLVEIEEVEDLAPKYQGVYVVKVVSCEAIPNTHLHLCQIDAGEHTAEFAEDGKETVQVVCGAPNVHAGMLAVWITPGAIVPETYGGENFKLSARKLQGYVSYGMLAGADELGFPAEHKTIVEIDPKDAQAGDSFAEAFGLNDLIIDVENKSLTHRPDCFGLVGFAREVAGILGQNFVEPEWVAGGELKASGDVKIEVEIADSEICPRYSCAVFDLKANEPSKYLTKEAVFLAKAGMRTIDPMVDLTNIMMLETGQPLHAFDYDKLMAVGGDKGAKIIVRSAKAGEELQLLDGKTIECVPEDILITSNDVPVALAGAMGGKNTEIDASTKRVVLESATFSLYHLRKTQMAHGIFSEAITRFTKGQPAPMTLPVLAETVKRLGVEALAMDDEWPEHNKSEVIELETSDVNKLLGTNYSTKEMAETLMNVGFEVKFTDKPAKKVKKLGILTMAVEYNETELGHLKVTAPKWRTDIHIAEDVIEEIGRLRGFDNIELDLPSKPFRGVEIQPMWQLKKELRGILSGDLRMNELLTYSFVSKDLLKKVGQDPEDSYEIVNSISPELQRFRQQIAPSLLSKVRENVKAGHENFVLYEMNQVSKKSDGLSGESTPILRNHLGIVGLEDFYGLKAQILAMLKKLGINLEYAAMGANVAGRYPYLEPQRSAVLLLNGEVIGAFGEVKAPVCRHLKIDGTVAAAELELDDIVNIPRIYGKSMRISKFPFVERDLTLKVGSDAQYGRFLMKIEQVLQGEGLVSEVIPSTVYQANEDDPTKNISFHLKFSSPEKTLEQNDISAIIEKITVEIVGLGAEII